MNLRTISSTFMLLILTACSSSGAERPHAGRPNVVIIILDDVGFSDLGSYGSEIRTPAIDSLATDGLRYNRFDTKAICSATRASLLTGRNAQSIRMGELPSRLPAADASDTSKTKGELPTNIQTIAERLRLSGYGTYAIGKWHLAPEYEQTPDGARDSWPLQRGFDRYYGFLSGWTDQFRPLLASDNAVLGVRDAATGYHLTTDLIDHAISWLASHRRASPNNPYFLYLALGAAHAPIQAPEASIDRYEAVYDKGWDAVRLERFERMRALGIIPASTRLPAPNPGDRRWADLSDMERRVFARFMEVYAGFLDHADAEIGRLIDDLKKSGDYENTLIILMSDNGAAGEAGQAGRFEHPYTGSMTIEAMDRQLDDLGSVRSSALYPRPWAMVGATPFERYKVWPQAGGVRAPLIISWPEKIHDNGAVRSQFVDVIDLAPTIAEAAGVSFPDVVNQVPQIPVAGRSILPTFASGAAPSGRNVQYFELRGNRSITAGDWKAVAMHRIGDSFDADRWTLHYVPADFSESVDLASGNPAKLEELKALWWQEAKQYASPPLVESPRATFNFYQFGDAFLPPEASDEPD
ncbi:MAG: arylsulfatase [Alphaproteobacteria bacterium]|nr:arylsulfatase [Alphaproteobacteria bacterium]